MRKGLSLAIAALFPFLLNGCGQAEETKQDNVPSNFVTEQVVQDIIAIDSQEEYSPGRHSNYFFSIGSDGTNLCYHPTNLEENVWSVELSPDNRRVAYVSGKWNDPGKEPRVLRFIKVGDFDYSGREVLEKDGFRVTMLPLKNIENIVQEFYDEPDWSPDGTKLAVHMGAGGSQTQIYIIDVEGKTAKQITFEDDVRNLSPTWGPDGDKIYFESNRYNSRGKIFSYDLRTREIKPVTERMFSQEDPDAGPEGIVFCSDRTGTYEIYKMNYDGSGLTRLTEDPYYDHVKPRWNKDGTKVIYESEGEYYIVGSDGLSKPLMLTNFSEWRNY